MSRASKRPADAPLGAEEQRRWARVGVLAALTLMLSYAETFVPVPLPGVKLGLANIPVLVALALGDISGATSVAAIKVLASGALFGSPLTMAYAAAGTMLSLVGMVPLSRLRTMRLWMVSIVGALLHEVGQLAVASVVLGSNAVWRLSFVLLTAGCITGALCGVLATSLVPSFRAGLASTELAPLPAQVARRPPDARAKAAFVCLGVFVVFVLHVYDLGVLSTCAGAAMLSCVAVRVPPRTIFQALGPLLALAIGTYVVQVLLAPADALAQTGVAMGRLASIAAASAACTCLVPTRDLPGTVAWLVGPLARLGIDTRGFVLAFGVAVALIPTIATTTRAHFAQRTRRPSPAELRTLLPALMQAALEKITTGGRSPSG